MFESTLISGAKENLALLGQSGLLKDAYLAGGTAVALQLGHRISLDFDFFTPKTFDPRAFAADLAKLGEFEEEQASKGTLLGNFKKTKFSLFIYEYPMLYPPLEFCGIQLADIRDLAAMKIDVISTRGAKRDFVDLFFICREQGFHLSVVLNFYERKYGKLGSNLFHIKKSLIYFEDAESDKMPQMLKKINWEEIKRVFQSEVKKLAAFGM